MHPAHRHRHRVTSVNPLAICGLLPLMDTIDNAPRPDVLNRNKLNRRAPNSIFAEPNAADIVYGWQLLVRLYQVYVCLGGV